MTPAIELQNAVQPEPDKSYEIVSGKMEEKEMPGARHSGVCGRLTHKLRDFVASHNLGEVYPEASFQIGENELILDLAYVSAGRIPAEGEPETKWPMPPDLAIEIMSPNDFYEKVYAKAIEYLSAGVKQVWVISPENQVVTVYRSATNIVAFPPDSELVSEDLLPGFRCRLDEIFFRRTPAG